MDELFEGRAKGGIATARRMSPEQLKERARKRVFIARWGVKALHRGNFEKDFHVDVDCYVLDDASRRLPLSVSVGWGRPSDWMGSGAALQRFLATKAMADAAGAEIRTKSLENPIKFQWGTGGADSPPPSVVYGFDATLLIDLCNTIIAAELDREDASPARRRTGLHHPHGVSQERDQGRLYMPSRATIPKLTK